MREFIPAPIVKDVADRALQYLYSPINGQKNPKEAIMALWSYHKARLAESTDAELLDNFEQDIFKAMGPQNDVSKGSSINKALSKYQTQSENGLMGLWVDFFDFLNAVDLKPEKADMKWLRLLARPEKFYQFFESDKRYMINGFRNQALISKAISDRSVDSLKPIIIMKEDFEKLLDFDFDGDPSNERSYQFEKTNFVLNKIRSLKSLTSIIAPQSKNAFFTKNNTEWKGQDPTQEQIDKYKLEKKTVTNFISKPVWLVDDLKWMLSINQSIKLDEILSLRNTEEPQKFGGLDNAVDAVNHFIHITSALMSVHVQNGVIEGYKPLEDVIVFNNLKIEENPWIALSTYTSMLAQATCHVNERDYQKTDTENLIIDDLHNTIIGHTAVMQLYHHLQDINMGYLSQEEETSLKHYQEDLTKTNRELIELAKHYFISETNVNFKQIENFLKSVSETQQLINTGISNGQKLTPEIRKSALNVNVKKYYKGPQSSDVADLQP